MSAKAETRLVGKIRDRLLAEAAARGQRIKVEKRHGSEFSVAGEPDLFGCLDGKHFELEVKVKPNKPTPLQLLRLNEWARVGAIQSWVTSPEEAVDALWPTVAKPSLN